MAKKRRFYRPPPPLSNLPRIVWSEKHNRAIAEFGKDNDPEYPNQFVTDKEEVAEILVELGYREVSMEAEAPPYIPEMRPQEVGDIKVKPNGFSEQHEAQRIKRESLLKKVEEEPEDIPPVPERKKPPTKVASPIAPVTKPTVKPATSPKKTLKRRRDKK